MDLTGTIINGHRHIQREHMNTEGEIVVHKSNREAWNRFFPHNHQKSWSLILGS